MKKIQGIIGLLATAVLMFSCASTQKVEVVENTRPEPTFKKDYNNCYYRMYSSENFNHNKYRSNFKSIPKGASYAWKEGFDGKVALFTLDGNKLYLGFKSTNGINSEVLTDDQGNVYFNNANYADEDSGFVFEEGGNIIAVGFVFETEINGEKYVLAIAAGQEFKMWVEDSLPSDSAETVKDSQGLENYDGIDVKEGIYKPGFKRIWGKAAPEYQKFYDMNNFKIYKYNYNGVDFVIGGKSDLKNYVLTLDGKTLEPASKTYFRIMEGNKDNRNFGQGWCYEGKVKIGGKKVTMAVVLWEGDIRVFIKE